jgi:anion-transporting  ArsA/GET3 family ATPase
MLTSCAQSDTQVLLLHGGERIFASLVKKKIAIATSPYLCYGSQNVIGLSDGCTVPCLKDVLLSPDCGSDYKQRNAQRKMQKESLEQIVGLHDEFNVIRIPILHKEVRGKESLENL